MVLEALLEALGAESRMEPRIWAHDTGGWLQHVPSDVREDSACCAKQRCGSSGLPKVDHGVQRLSLLDLSVPHEHLCPVLLLRLQRLCLDEDLFLLLQYRRQLRWVFLDLRHVPLVMRNLLFDALRREVVVEDDIVVVLGEEVSQIVVLREESLQFGRGSVICQLPRLNSFDQ